MLDEISLDSGVSPVVGVILMVAVTVILSAVVGLFATGLNDNTQENAKAGVTVSDNGDGTVDVQAISIDRADEIRVLVDGTQQATIPEVGETKTVSSGLITIVGVLDGETTVLQTSDRTTDGTNGDNSDNTGDNSDNTGDNSDNTETVPGTITTTVNGSEVSVTYQGSGTTENPYKISNLTELQAMQENMSANYELVNDIDASATKNWNNEKGFKPIGEFRSEFTGNLDGKNHAVDSLFINRTSGPMDGLVGINGGTVENIAVTNADVSGFVGVGGLVGENQGTVSNAEASGNMSGDRRVGVLVGTNNEGTVSNSEASGNASGDNSRVGGLVGDNDGTVSNSSASGNVSGNKKVGGLVGTNFEGTVSNAEASVNVSGNKKVGGLAGRNSGGTVENSFATGAVSGDGGLVGVDGSETDSYWDQEATNQSTSAGDGTGLKTSEMQGDSATSNMDAFDFDNVWQTVEGDYPELQE